MTRSSITILGIAAGILSGLTACDREPSISYKTDVAPILSKYCNECHLPGGKGAEKAGFLVESYDTVMQGTKFGPVIMAGDATSSTLYRLVSGQADESIRMPHGKEDRLTDKEVMIVQQWIDQGAPNN
jgi:uncharacterized membrane protein